MIIIKNIIKSYKKKRFYKIVDKICKIIIENGRIKGKKLPKEVIDYIIKSGEKEKNKFEKYYSNGFK